MDDLITNTVDDHSRTIVHIDLDCFYAQVEMIKNPSLCNVPLGVQQKNIVVTSNYVARALGVKKCMLISDAMRLCPSLVLVKGEDLYEYRKMSYQITMYLHQYSSLVERLGLDENFIDVSSLVNDRLHTLTSNAVQLEGHVFSKSSEYCQCGCRDRLKIGSVVAQEIRNGLKEKFKLTSCAGIAHNKLLAKLVGTINKPNQQTTIFPNTALELMLTLNDVSNIPGVGYATTEILSGLNINTIAELQNCSIEKLKSALTLEKAQWILDLSYGRDTSLVKVSGKPQSIGLEDSCKVLAIDTEVKAKFHQLLTRLMILVSEDGRIPTTIKVTIRKFDNTSKISHRETRQCNISPRLFTAEKLTNAIHLNEHSENKVLSIIMHLFSKLINTSQSYHITLLGLSFTKFQERVNGKNSIASYFIKDVSVQSITNIENTESIQNAALNLRAASYNDFNTDESETEMEPSSKKSKINSLITSSSCYSDSEYSSPSKLKVADLHLNCKDGDKTKQFAEAKESCSRNMDTNQNVCCPPNVDQDVFRQLPVDIQQELWNEWKRNRSREDPSNKPSKKAKTNTLLNYFVQHY